MSMIRIRLSTSDAPPETIYPFDTSILTLLQNTSGTWGPLLTFLQDLSGTWSIDLTADTAVRDLTGNWQSTYVTVSSLSGNWQETYSIVQLNSATNWSYQGTDLKDLSSNWQGVYLTFKELSSTFLTSETDAQTLVYNENTQDLSITNGNTVSLSSLTKITDFNSYKTDVGSATATLVKSVDFNNYKTEVGSATATLVKTTDFNSYKTDVESATATLVKSVDFNNYKTDVESATATLVESVDFNNYKTEVGSATATLLPTTTYQNASGNWQGTFTQVESNSATNWNNELANLYTRINFLPLTGGIISGATRINNNLTIFGDLTATGITSFANTVFSTTSALSVVHVGSGPAVYVGNNGDGDIASFYDIDQNIEVLHVGGINSTNPNVGIRTSTPNKTLTVNGELSANSIIYDNTGNSSQWNQAFNVATTYQNASSTLVKSVDFNSYKTDVESATATLVKSVDFNNYKTDVESATATLVKSVDFNNYKTDVESATATLVKSVDFNNYKTDVESATATLVKSVDFNNYKTDVESATATLVKSVDFNSYKTDVESATATLVKATDFNNYKTDVESATATLVKSVDFNSYKTDVESATATLVKSVDFNSYKTDVESATATLLPTTIYQNASGNWESVYTVVLNTSATNWDNILANQYTDNNFIPLTRETVTITLTPFVSTFSNTPSLFYPEALSGTIPYLQFSKALTNTGSLNGTFLFGLSATINTKHLVVEFSDNSSFTNPFQVINLDTLINVSANINSLCLNFKGLGIGSNKIVFTPPTSICTEGGSVHELNLYTHTETNDLFYRIGFRPENEDSVMALSAGQIKIIP